MRYLIPAMFCVIISLTAFMPKGTKVGKKAPEFTLKNVTGEMVSLSDYSKGDGGVILIFTCNHCPYAKLYEDRIKALHAKYQPQGWPVVAINPNDPAIAPDDSYERMQEIATAHAYDFPYLFDEAQTVFSAYGATRTPQVFLLENTNKGFKVAYIGAIDDQAKDASAVSERFVENAIESLKKGEKIEVTETKAIGCSIKVKS